MILFGIMLTVASAGLIAMELGQPRAPRKYMVWDDETEQRMVCGQPSCNWS